MEKNIQANYSNCVSCPTELIRCPQYTLCRYDTNIWMHKFHIYFLNTQPDLLYIFAPSPTQGMTQGNSIIESDLGR